MFRVTKRAPHLGHCQSCALTSDDLMRMRIAGRGMPQVRDSKRHVPVPAVSPFDLDLRVLDL